MTSPPGIERQRLVTVLCFELAGSAELSQRLRAEDFHDLQHAVRRTCRLAATRYGGHVLVDADNEVRACFGYPEAFEDDAVRAVRAALGVLAGVSDLSAGFGERLKVRVDARVAVHSGFAVVDATGELSGEVIDAGVGLLKIAAPGHVLASSATSRLVQGYAKMQSRGVQPVPGAAAPMELFEVQEETQARSRLDAAAVTGLSPYVGRQAELSTLERVWQEVRAGGERVVIVRGEAGIGKSRLLDRFQQTALQESAIVLKCFCTQLTQGTALAPVIDMLDRRIDELVERSNSEERLKALAASLAEHSRFGPEALPLLAALLSLPGADETPLAGMSVAYRRTRTLSVLRTWLSFIAERAPTLLLFEDLHWADATTVDFIQDLARMGGGRRVLVCATSRPELDAGWAPDDVMQLELRPLLRVEAEALAVRVAGGRALPARVAFQVVERSEGVPLFVEEITRATIESGALVDRGDRYEFTGDLRGDIVPVAVADSLLARFEHLGPSRPIAQLSAAIGREFTYPLLLAVSGLPDVGLRHHLSLLCDSGLVLAQPDGSGYAFKHVLVHQAIYDTIPEKDRRDAHARILAVLRKDFAFWLMLHPEAGAYHAEQAGLRREAIDYHRMAGLRALSRTEAAGAARHLTRALDMLDAVEEPERSKIELELIVPASQSYIAVYGYASPDTRRACERARNLALARKEMAAALMATNSLCTVLIVSGELRAALVLARELMESPAVAANPLLRTAALQAEGNTLYYAGHFAAAHRDSQEGLDIFEREKDRNPAVRLGAPLTALSWVQSAALAVTGQLDQVPECLRVWEERQRLYRSLGSLPKNAEIVNFTTLAVARASTPLFLCVVLYLSRDQERIPALAAEALAVSEAERLSLWYSIARMFLAFNAGVRHRDPAQGAEAFRRAVAAYQATGSRVSLSLFVGMLAELLLAANQPEEALKELQSELHRIEPEHEYHFQPELVRLTGRALTALRRNDEAADAYRRAIESGRALGARLFSLRAASDLYLLTGDEPERQLLQQEYDGFTEGFGFADLKEARALLKNGRSARGQTAT